MSTVAPMATAESGACPFCGGERRFVYTLNARGILRCTKCGTLGVREMPSPAEVETFYQGFAFQADPANLGRILTRPIRRWMSQFVPSGPGRMLDVGGGGGFFAKAFEKFGLGESTYLDIDGEACTFASSELGLERVHHASAADLDRDTVGGEFDFVYCRHLIEHLVDPVGFVRACVPLLAAGGTLVLQCPNGLSKEGVLYPEYWRRFLDPAAAENRWSRAYARWFSLTSSFGWGLDPIRHLWAISARGLEAIYANDASVRVKTRSASLADPVYSPYWSSPDRAGRLRDECCRLAAGRLLRGMHLIARIQKAQEHP